MLAEIGEQVLLLRNWWPALPALAFVFTKPGSEVCGISLKIIIYKKKKVCGEERDAVVFVPGDPRKGE